MIKSNVLSIIGNVSTITMQSPIFSRLTFWYYYFFSVDGQSGECVSGCSDKVRNSASIYSWYSLEVNGLILVWYHVDRLAPEWSPIAIPEINSSLWTYQGRNEYHVSAHIQDINENGAGQFGNTLMKVLAMKSKHSTTLICFSSKSDFQFFRDDKCNVILQLKLPFFTHFLFCTFFTRSFELSIF